MKPVVLSCVFALFIVAAASVSAVQDGRQASTQAEPLEGFGAGDPVAPLAGLQSSGAAFSLSRALDQGRIVSTRDGFVLSGRGYRADVSASGLRFVPTSVPVDVPARGRTGELQLALTGLVSADGARELEPSGPPMQPGGLFGSAVVTPYSLDGIAQTVQAHPDGVELGVWMVQRPEERGDLRLVFALQASVERLLVETLPGVHEELVFGGQGSVRIGRALAIDAAGRRTELTLRALPGRLEIELDEALLATAAFPLWIDPKLGSTLPIGGSASTRDVDPDTVFDPITGEFLVVWERAISASESDVWGARVDSAGTLAVGPFPIDVTASTLTTRPRIAVDPASGNYLVAYEDDVLGGPGKTVRWSLFDSADTLVASQSFTISGYLADAVPDVGFVQGPTGSSGFALVHRRDSLTTPNSTVQVTWIDAVTGAQIDSQTVSALSPPRDDLPAVAQLSQNGETLVAFERFDTAAFILDVRASCIGLGSGSVTLGTPLAVTSDSASADGAPDVSVVNGTYQVVWERLILSNSNRNLRGREVLSACAGFAGSAFDLSTLVLLEAAPAVVAGRYSGGCDGQSLVLLTTTSAPAGSGPKSIVTRRWDSGGSLLGPLESVALGQTGGASYSTPRAALDMGSTTLPRFLVVYDDDGSGANASAEVFGQLVTFDTIPLTATVAPVSTTDCVGQSLTLDATVTGTGPFSYQWRQDGVPIPGATASSYTIAALSTFSAGTYDVEVLGTCGGLLSTPADVVVEQPITGLAIALSANPVCVGTNVTLTASSATGVPTTYEWFHGGVLLQSTSAPSLLLSAVQVPDAGSYTVRATNTCGAVTSAVPAVLQVDEPITNVSIAVSASPVCAGSDVTLTATVASGIPASYGWFHDGVFIQATPVPTLVLSAVQPSDAGAYSVTAGNSCGNVSSAIPATLEVEEPITGVTIAVSASPVCAGSNVILTAATATGVPTTYGWFRDGTFLQVTTVPTLGLSNVQPSNAGDYTVRTSNSCGTVSSAIPAVLQVDLPITAVTLAVNANPVCTGTDVTIAATPTGGTPSTYGWFRDGVFLKLTAIPTLVVPAVQLSDAGAYTVRASNACGTMNSAAPIVLQVDDPITGVTIAISESPVCAGTNVALTASTATGVPSSYGWFRGGVFLQTTSTPILSLSSVGPSNAGAYTVRAINACGAVSSTVPAILEVDEPIIGVSIEVDTSPACVGSTVNFTASTTSGTPTIYGWFRNGAFLQTTTLPTLQLQGVQQNQAGQYTVTAGNSCGTSSSQVPAQLLVSEPIGQVTIQASSPSGCIGSSVTFTATVVTGVGPYLYEWRRDGLSLGPPSSQGTLVVSPVQPSDAGSYQVIASNACGSMISAPVAFSVFGSPTVYCTAKPNSLGCASTMTWNGTPSVSAGSGFDITWGPSPGGAGNFGIFVYTLTGTSATPVTNIYGTFCLKLSAIRRSPPVISGGTVGSCSGFFSIDWNAYAASASAPPLLQMAGTPVDLQCWHRDNANPGGANLSNAISFVMCP